MTFARRLRQQTVFLSPLAFMLNTRMMFMSLLSFCVLVSALCVVYTKHLSRSLYIQLQNLQQARDALHVEWTQLLLEQSTLASDVRVERIAREQLKMKVPSLEQIMVVKP